MKRRSFADRRGAHPVDQSRTAVGVLVPLIHLRERFVALMDGEHRPFDQPVERRIRHDDGDLDDAVGIGLEPGHFHVQPDQIHVAAHERRLVSGFENVSHEGQPWWRAPRALSDARFWLLKQFVLAWPRQPAGTNI